MRQRINQKILSIESEKPEVHEVNEGNVCAIPIRIYRPNAQENLPVALLIHGGGWVGGNLETHDYMARYLCQHGGVVVVSVEYTNSPEAQFPLPLEQCFEVLTWITSPQNPLCIDFSKVAVIGDSAGGNMAAALCLMARDRLGPPIALQVLINPSPDLTFEGVSPDHHWEKSLLHWFASQYVKQAEDLLHPYASPTFSNNFCALPPAVIILAEKDEQRPDGQRYADHLSSSGVPTRVFIQENTGHLAGQAARASPKAQDSLNVASEALNQLVDY